MIQYKNLNLINFKKLKYFGFIFIVNFSLLYTPTLAGESHKLNDIEINNSTKSDLENNMNFPSNPFEIVDMLRRANSMNDATNPSDAIDDALKSFDMINTNQ